MSRILPFADLIVGGLRTASVERLRLQPGDSVLDVGCGTGSSLSRLHAAVGSTGRVVGVEIDPNLAERCRRRIQRHGWANVQLLEAPAQSVRLESLFDGLLLFAAHEVLTSRPALDNLFSQLKPGARVVAVGARTPDGPAGNLFEPVFGRVSRMWLPNSPLIDAQPWHLLPERVELLDVDSRGFGLIFIVSGQVPA